MLTHLIHFCDLPSGRYHLRGSDYIPAGVYWIEVASKGYDATLSIRKNGEEVGFINAYGSRLWHGFWESEMIPCCDLRHLSFESVVSVAA